MNDLGFGPTEDWLEEDEDDVEATRYVYDLFRRILEEGHRLDFLDLWEGEEQDFRTLEIDIQDVPRDHFRLLAGIRVDFCFGSQTTIT